MVNTKKKEELKMATEMEDKDKGGEDRIKKAKEEQQKEMDKKDVEKPGEYHYPESEGELDKETPPPK